MRANGVRTLAVWCDGLGHHHCVLDVSSYRDEVPVPAFGPRVVCTSCGAIGADARLNWNERAPVDDAYVRSAEIVYRTSSQQGS
jgi:hypothetical protein